jgi:MoxR-like ATPase
MKINDLTIDGLEQENYFATQELIDVVNAAIFLDKPLLIEGPAGTGKTFLAKTLSALLNLELIRLQCHEGIDEDKSVYEWNYKKQLLSIQKSEENENLFDEKYLIKRPILTALTTEENSLFLIDEIDRSDEEFEALLLEVLAENQVTIPEFGTIKGSENRITILTSNSTRELSDALRRRCIYYYLDFPSIEIETKVFMNSIVDIDENEARKYASLVSFIRSLSLNKIPSLIESVEWVKYNNSKDQESVRSNLGILLKDKSDQKKYVEKLEESNEFNQE